MGAGSLRELFDEQFFGELEGGILESFGRLFKSDLKLFAYPLLDAASGALTTVNTLEVASHLRKLCGDLVERGCIVPLDTHHPEYLRIFSRDVLELIERGDERWETMVRRAWPTSSSESVSSTTDRRGWRASLGPGSGLRAVFPVGGDPVEWAFQQLGATTLQLRGRSRPGEAHGAKVIRQVEVLVVHPDGVKD